MDRQVEDGEACASGCNQDTTNIRAIVRNNYFDSLPGIRLPEKPLDHGPILGTTGDGPVDSAESFTGIRSSWRTGDGLDCYIRRGFAN